MPSWAREPSLSGTSIAGRLWWATPRGYLRVRQVNIRIIPRLDIKGPNLVKGIHFEGLRVLGKPERFARYYYENGADELIYMDAVASLVRAQQPA